MLCAVFDFLGTKKKFEAYSNMYCMPEMVILQWKITLQNNIFSCHTLTSAKLPGKHTIPSSSRPLILLKADSCEGCWVSEEDILSVFKLWSLVPGPSAVDKASLLLGWESDKAKNIFIYFECFINVTTQNMIFGSKHEKWLYIFNYPLDCFLLRDFILRSCNAFL